MAFFDEDEDEDLLLPEKEEDDQEVVLEDKKPEKKAKGGKEEEELQIEVEDDPLYAKPNWKEDPAKKIDAKGDDDYSKRVSKRVGDLKAVATELKRQHDQKDRELAEAIRFAQNLQRQNTELTKKATTGNFVALERDVAAEEANAALAEREYNDALSAGDAGKAAAANSKVADAKAKAIYTKRELAQAKAAYEAEPKREAAQPERQQFVAPPSSRVQWFKSNPWFNPQGGDELSDHALRTHNKLYADGVALDSPEYFKEIGKSMADKFPDSFKSARPKSPVTPNGAGRAQSKQDNNGSVNKVVLSKAQVAMAAKLGLSLQVYAKEVARMAREENQ